MKEYYVPNHTGSVLNALGIIVHMDFSSKERLEQDVTCYRFLFIGGVSILPRRRRDRQ